MIHSHVSRPVNTRVILFHTACVLFSTFGAFNCLIVDLYTYLGDKQRKKKDKDKYGNFLTYARKAHLVFCESKLLDSDINKQVKKELEEITKYFNLR